MYVQMVWGRTRPGAWDGLRKLYVDKVLPLTMAMPGVRERQLWRGASDPDEMVFWSVWDSLGELRNYEVSDARRDLAQEADQYFYPLAYPKGETWIKAFRGPLRPQRVSQRRDRRPRTGHDGLGKAPSGYLGPVRALLPGAGGAHFRRDQGTPGPAVAPQHGRPGRRCERPASGTASKT